ncbi:hypothetical protein DIPPA_08205 [Diplonema papillatum]|nr:hypothetical protein DIPPA_08205 [Diplonema papillatum]
MSGSTWVTMWSPTWQSYAGGMVAEYDSGLKEPVFTMTDSVLLRVVTGSDAGAGSAESFSIFFHTYDGASAVATKVAPAVGEVAVFAVDYPSVDKMSHINLKYEGAVNDDWQVAAVMMYRNKEWVQFYAPDAHMTAQDSASVTKEHRDIEWFDLSERPSVNTIATRWTTDRSLWSGSTNIYLVFYHSETVVHFAGAIHDTQPNDVSIVNSTNCTFPIDELRMVSVKALKGHLDDGWWVKSTEILNGSTWVTMWSPTWQSYAGGMVAEYDSGLKEPVFTMTDSVLLRVVTGSDAGAGSAESFSIFFHTYDGASAVATKVAPAVGEVAVFAVDYPSVDKMSHINLKYEGAVNDDWQVAAVMMYRNKEWVQFYAPDAHMTAQDSASVTKEHRDIEWFDLSERPSVNTIATRWTTDRSLWSGSTNIYLVFYHSETVVHFAGAIHDTQPNDVSIVNSTNCPFPIDELRMVSVKALKGHLDDGWWLKSTEIMSGSTWVTMWSPTWQSYAGGMVAEYDSGLKEPVFTMTDSVLLRVVTGSDAGAGSAESFSIFFHTYDGASAVATKVAPAVGEVAVFAVDYPSVDKVSHINLKYEGAVNDDWQVAAVMMYRNKEWVQFYAPDAHMTAQDSASVTKEHRDIEWFDLSERPSVNTIATRWTTDRSLWSGSTNIYLVFYHSETVVHFAGAIHDTQPNDVSIVNSTNCTFPIDELRMVSVKALKGHLDDGWWVKSTEILNGSTWVTMWSPTWQSYAGGMVAEYDSGLKEPVFTMTDSVLLRVVTGSDAGAGSAESFSIFFHTYDGASAVATKVAPAVGEVAVFAVDYPSVDKVSHINLKYEGAVNDDWQVAAVMMYRNKEWVQFYAPDAHMTAQDSASVTKEHRDIEWFDLSERPSVNTIATRWTTDRSLWSGSTNIYLVFYHSETVVHFAGAIHDTQPNDVSIVNSTNCTFPIDELRMVSVKALKGHLDDGWWVKSTEILNGSTWVTMWSPTWQSYAGGMVAEYDSGLKEPVFTMTDSVLLRVVTGSDAGAGSAESFSIFFHTYDGASAVATKVAPAVGEVAVFAVDYPSVDKVSHINLKYEGAVNDDWQVAAVMMYRNKEWVQFYAPDAHMTAQDSASVTKEHRDIEWFDLSERPSVNTIATRWTTDRSLWSGSTNIYLVFYHSETVVHFAGAIHDTQPNDVSIVNSTNCTFPIDELRMVSVKALKGHLDDGWWVKSTEILNGSTWVTMWSPTWQSYAGGMVAEYDSGLKEPVFTMTDSVLLRVVTGSDAGAGSAESFSIFFHTYDGASAVATKVAPAVGEVAVFAVDYPSVDKVSHINLKYEGAVNDDWQVAAVMMYRNKEWVQFYAPDAHMTAQDSASVTKEHRDIEWFDLSERPSVNTIATRWTTDRSLWSGSTNIYLVFYHSETVVHFAGAIHDTQPNDVSIVNSTNCTFPIDELRMVSVKALKGHLDDGWWVKSTEILNGSTWVTMWSPTWQSYAGGMVAEYDSGLKEPVFTMTDSVLLRVVTGSDAGAGSAESFSIFFHTYDGASAVATKVAPAVGEVAVFAVDYPSVDKMSHINLKYEGAVNDDWQVAAVMMYRNKEWVQFYAPDAHMTAQDSASVTKEHRDIEWFDLSERPSVNTIATRWTTDRSLWSGSTNIYLVFYHSETVVHFAGAIHDTQPNDVSIVNSTNCTFPIDELRMVSVKALKGHLDDGWWVKSTEILNGSTWVTMWSPTWQSYAGGMVAEYDSGLKEPVFTMTDSVLLRVVTGSDAGAGSAESFSIFFHTYDGASAVATKVAPAVGEVAVFAVDYPSVDKVSHINLKYEGAVNDDWQVAAVMMYRNKEWVQFYAPDAHMTAQDSASVTKEHRDIEWFDLSERPSVNTIATRWTTDRSLWSGSTNIYLVFYHSETVVHFAGAIHDTQPNDVSIVNSTNCTFPIDELRMVSVKALKGHLDDGWWVKSTEILNGSTWVTMWSPTWQSYAGGMVAEYDSGLKEPVFTMTDSVLLRVVTGSDAGAGSAESFSIFFHTYDGASAVATKVAPAVGEVAVFAVDYPSVDKVSHINLKYEGAVNDDWQVAAVMMYRNKEWVQFYAPDAHMTAQDSASVTKEHRDIEWFDLSERPSVNTIATRWTTDRSLWSGSTNIYLVFYHSETVVHFAGAIHDTQPNDVSIVNSTNCTFPIDELRMVSVKALKGHLDDGWWLKSTEIMSGSTWVTMWSPTWQSYAGGMVAEYDSGLKEPVFTMTDSVLLRVVTGSDAGAGSAESFSIFFHTYDGASAVATKVAPAVGEVAVFAVDYPSVDKVSHINLKYEGAVNDDWQVAAVMMYRNKEWVQFYAPDAHMTAQDSASVTKEHRDIEWFDLSERPSVNTIATRWTTDRSLWSGSTNIYLVFYHSETVVHFAGAIHDTQPNDVSIVNSTNCTFPIDELRMVSVKALKGHLDDGWWLKSTEIMNGSTWVTMWSPTWQSYAGGMVAEYDSGLKEPVFTMTDSVLLRVVTGSDAGAGSAESFSIFFHTYDGASAVATKVAPAVGEVAVFAVDYPSVDKMSHINLKYEGAVNDDWQVAAVMMYRNKEWVQFYAPDAHMTAQDSASVTKEHRDIEWFDLSERPSVNTIATRWTTDRSLWSGSTNIYLVFYHSETVVHFAGAIHDTQPNDVSIVNSTNCPFRIDELRMVSVKALKGHLDDGWWLKSTEIMSGSTWVTMWSPTWQSYAGGMVAEYDSGLKEPVFTMTDSVLLRVVTGSDAGAGSAESFSIFFHTYDGASAVATKVAPAVGEVAVFAVDYPSVDKMSHINLKYEGAVNDDWQVAAVMMYRNKEWVQFYAPDAHMTAQDSASVTKEHRDIEWFDLSERPSVNTIATRWTTDRSLWSGSTNIYLVFYHSETVVHFAGAIHDTQPNDVSIVNSTNCPFPIDELRMVSVKALKGHLDDGWWLKSTEIMSGSTWVTMWSPTWQSYAGGMVAEYDSGLKEPVFTMTDSVLLRVVTGSDAGAGSAESFSIFFHTYDGASAVATKVAPAVGEVAVFAVDYPSVDKMSHINLKYEGAVNDDWQVAAVMMYRNKEWVQFYAPDAHMTAQDSASVTKEHRDIEWFDLSERPSVNTIATRWTTDRSLWSGSTNIYLVFYHSETVVHFAGAIHDTQPNDVSIVNSTNCTFPIDELRMVSVKALKGHLDDGWWVKSTEILNGSTWVTMWSPTWQSYAGGMVAEYDSGLKEPVFTMTDSVLLRVVTGSDAGAGSAESFSIFFHTYDGASAVATKVAPAVGEVAVFAVDYPSVDKVSHINLKYEGAVNDDWQVAAVMMYRNKEWVQFYAPDAHMTAQDSASVTKEHRDIEWFDLSERPSVNTIATRWTTDRSLWSGSTNIYLVFYHSETVVHFAGAIHDTQPNDVSIVNSTNCPFPIDELRMVSVKGLKGHVDDGWWLKSTEIMNGSTWVTMWSPTWQSYAGGVVCRSNPSRETK